MGWSCVELKRVKWDGMGRTGLPVGIGAMGCDMVRWEGKIVQKMVCNGGDSVVRHELAWKKWHETKWGCM
jgi:hypothetical protein